MTNRYTTLEPSATTGYASLAGTAKLASGTGTEMELALTAAACLLSAAKRLTSYRRGMILATLLRPHFIFGKLVLVAEVVIML